MPKVNTATANVVHKMEEKQVIPVMIQNEKPKEDGHKLQRVLKCDDISLSKLVKNSMGRVVQCAGCMVLYLIDFIVNFSHSQWVRNVLVVFLTVSLEAFVVIVLAICTVLTAIIVNTEDAYKRYSGGGVTVVPRDETGVEEIIPVNVNYRQDGRMVDDNDLGNSLCSSRVVI